MAVIVDSSLWIEILAGNSLPEVEEATAAGSIILPPLVIAELLSGDNSLHEREFIGGLLQEFELHDTPLEHWMLVGALRRTMASHGVNVTIPDAHVAQCALDRDATLLSRDRIFDRIARHTSLRLSVLR